jgi:hypothetical protein
VDGTFVIHMTHGDGPHGYLVYTTDGHVFVDIAAHECPELFGRSALGPVLFDSLGPTYTTRGFALYCGTFEVRDGQAIHQVEFGIVPTIRGPVETRSVLIDGDRLILGNPRGTQYEWQRVH